MATTNIVVMMGAYVLLVKRRSPPEKDKWFTPGGILVKSGDVESQAIEILEDETGIKAYSLSLLTVDDEFFTEGYGTTDVHLVTIVYKYKTSTTEIVTNAEHFDIKWVPVTALPIDLHPNIRKWILKAIQEEVNKN